MKSSVFIWEDDKSILFYNSDNYERILQERHVSIKAIVDNLIDPSNFYSVLFSDADMMDTVFEKFINSILELEFGYICQFDENREKPIIVPPHYIFPRSFNKRKNNGLDYSDLNIINNLHSVVIQITGRCSLSCLHCKYFHKQMNHCSKSENELSLEAIQTIIHKIKLTNIRKIDIIGGNIFEHSYFYPIMEMFGNLPQTKIYHSNFKFVNAQTARFLLKDDSNALLKIVAEPLEIWLEELYLLIEELQEFERHLIWVFVLTSEVTLKNFELLVNKYKISHYEYHVLYNGENMNFLNDRRFLNEGEIWQLKLGIKNIFANQILNRNYFGKLTILADGQIYEDENTAPVGTISDNLENILYSLMSNDRAWFHTRLHNGTCSNCIYKFLCPPPSRLEKLLQREMICIHP